MLTEVCELSFSVMLRRSVNRKRVRSSCAVRGRLPTVNHGRRRGQSGARMNDLSAVGHAPEPMADGAVRPRPYVRRGCYWHRRVASTLGGVASAAIYTEALDFVFFLNVCVCTYYFTVCYG